jgi:hypothetical protein
MSETWAWATLGLLGAYHGANPAMGWLFAVALGLQEKSSRAVWAALPPIALGHFAAIGLTVGLLALGWVAVPHAELRWIVGGLLAGFGVWKLVRPRHPRWVGMRVGFRDLTLWSFLMATAHGAGLMLLPLFLVRTDAAEAAGAHAAHAAGPWIDSAWQAILAVGLHTGAMLVVATGVALLVYHKVGLSVLRTAWLDLDRVWAGTLIAAGILAAL